MNGSNWFTILEIFSIGIFGVVYSLDWSYNDISQWKESYPACNGYRQSPIDIRSDEVTLVKEDQDPFEFSDAFLRPMKGAVIMNTGVSYQINDTEDLREIRGGGLSSGYTLRQLHFHLGTPSRRLGSEHQIDGRQFSGEMHLVLSRNQQRDSSRSESHKNAPFEPNAVLAFFLQVSENDQGKSSEFWEKVTNSIQPLRSAVLQMIC
ncbi:carbonic anhydrase 13-like isoform X2 [Symsagittifera roscoffensis]|uniref:carbonic anhydrase 13-like isoform X2 n=1 Tax=Symsagittifera roscoffensis TaxID=84072 RepID=UPI00307B3648